MSAILSDMRTVVEEEGGPGMEGPPPYASRFSPAANWP